MEASITQEKNGPRILLYKNCVYFSRLLSLTEPFKDIKTQLELILVDTEKRLEEVKSSKSHLMSIILKLADMKEERVVSELLEKWTSPRAVPYSIRKSTRDDFSDPSPKFRIEVSLVASR